MEPGKPLGFGPRVFAVSDLHVDYPANMHWVESLPDLAHRQDTLIVAGDVTHDLGRLERALGSLRDKFAHLFFVPGNHELWLRDSDGKHSIEKFDSVMALCSRLGVSIRPQRICAGVGGDALWLVPLYSWYVMPEEGDGSLFISKPGEDPHLEMWADRYHVKWPRHAGFPRPADYFLQLNEAHLPSTFDAPVVSFSHFLPRMELMRRTSTERARFGDGAGDAHPTFNFSRVAGSTGIDEQLRRIGSSVHVYGHQHRNRWRDIDGVLYVSNCLGYPRDEDAAAPGGRCLWQICGEAA